MVSTFEITRIYPGGSIRENLLYGLKRDVSEDELIEVLEHSCLIDMISSLSKGLDTLIGERGVKLSAGEKQRLSIARAFLRNPEIVILDEPTSGLDSQTEEVVQKGIADLCKNRTVIVIAHRLATIREANHVVVMNDGVIEEQGTLEELINKEEFFYKYWKAQQL
jgi:ATP-binding cassette subfamily B protein